MDHSDNSRVQLFISTFYSYDFKNYWKNQDATDEVLDAEGWFRSGDLGLLDSDGFLYIKDRKNKNNIYISKIAH